MIGIQIHRYRIKSWEEKPHTKNPLAAERDIEKKTHKHKDSEQKQEIKQFQFNFQRPAFLMIIF